MRRTFDRSVETGLARCGLAQVPVVEILRLSVIALRSCIPGFRVLFPGFWQRFRDAMDVAAAETAPGNVLAGGVS